MSGADSNGNPPPVNRWLRLLSAPIVLLIYAYQWLLSPILHTLAPGSGCRFIPSCSEYALEAVRVHGPFAGAWLALKRIAKCHPLGGAGPDPVPARKQKVCGCCRLAVDRKPSSH